MVVGAKVPCILTSRGDSAKTKLYSIALAALNAK
jgi:phosphate butyryltransferase